MSGALEIFWASHRDQLLEGVGSLLEREVGNDFEIWCADPYPLRAHFFILQMFSPVLSDTDCRSLRLEDEEIKRKDVWCLLEFIYRGKTQVDVDRLEVVKKVAEKMGIYSFLELIAKIKVNKVAIGVEEKLIEVNPEQSGDNISTLENDAKELAIIVNGNIGDLFKKSSEIPDLRKAIPVLEDIEADEDSVESLNLDEENDSDFDGETVEDSDLSERFSETNKKKISINLVKKRRKRKSQIPDSLICFICKKKFKSKDSLRNHRICHLDPVQCPRCPLLVRRLDQHLASKHQMDQTGKTLENEFKCDQCDFACVASFLLRKHKRSRHSKLASAKCDQCSFITNTESNLKSHKRQVHSNERPFKCEVCGSGFKTSSVLSLHKARHMEKVECEFCGQKLCLTSIKRHRQLHLERGSMMRFKCTVCSFRSRYRYNLKVHLKKIHEMADGEIVLLTSGDAVRVKPDDGLTCETNEVSGKRKRSFKGRKKSVRKRRITEPAQKKKVCEICGLVLSCYSVLYRHRRMHREGEALKNRNKCPVCEFSTVQRCNLKVHCKKKHKMSDEQVNSILQSSNNYVPGT